MYCPSCRSEYRAGIAACKPCGVPLVEVLPAVEMISETDETAAVDLLRDHVSYAIVVNGAGGASGPSGALGTRVTLGASRASRTVAARRAGGASGTGSAVGAIGASATAAGGQRLDVPKQTSKRYRELIAGEVVLALEGPVRVTLEEARIVELGDRVICPVIPGNVRGHGAAGDHGDTGIPVCGRRNDEGGS